MALLTQREYMDTTTLLKVLLIIILVCYSFVFTLQLVLAGNGLNLVRCMSALINSKNGNLEKECCQSLLLIF